MCRLLHFWVDLVNTCVDLDSMISFLIWKKSCSQSAKPLNILGFL